jgi:hypothetical protein
MSLDESGFADASVADEDELELRDCLHLLMGTSFRGSRKIMVGYANAEYFVSMRREAALLSAARVLFVCCCGVCANCQQAVFEF